MQLNIMPNQQYLSENQRGFSMVELMIAMTLGLLILGGMITVFSYNSSTRAELEKSSRQIENARYAMQLISNDLSMAGYLGEYVPPQSMPLAAVPNPCATDAATLTAAMIIHVQGYNNSAAAVTCISDVKAGTDVIVVRRAAACTARNPQEAGCDAVTEGLPYLQVSGCSTDPDPYRLSTASASLTLRKVSCAAAALASIRRYLTHIYFVANNNLSGDGIPTLKRAELGAGAFTIVPLVEGIENLQFEYGEDTTASPGDGTPDLYTDYAAPAATVLNWWNVMSVRVALLARNETISAGYTDNKTYVLAGETYGPFGDNYRRQALSAVVKLANPAGRRE